LTAGGGCRVRAQLQAVEEGLAILARASRPLESKREAEQKLDRAVPVSGRLVVATDAIQTVMASEAIQTVDRTSLKVSHLEA
jgi:hypothetical protein